MHWLVCSINITKRWEIGGWLEGTCWKSSDCSDSVENSPASSPTGAHFISKKDSERTDGSGVGTGTGGVYETGSRSSGLTEKAWGWWYM